MERILVTGANGHLGFTITKKLCEKGYQVFAGVRNIQEKNKTKFLDQLPVQLVELDITNVMHVQKAVENMDGVFHTAAVFSLSGKKNTIIDSTVSGALNVVTAAHQANVKKVIYTSSSRVLGSVSTQADPLNEQSWNTDCKIPYFEAKIQAEKAVSHYAEKHGMNLICVLPSVILGPNIHRFSESTVLIQKIMLNKLPVVPPIAFNFVDVRDAADAHIAAYENPDASGRYIIGGDPFTLQQLINTIATLYPIKKPRVALNRTAFVLLSYALLIASKVSQKQPETSPKQAIEFTKGFRYFDLSKTEEELGIKVRNTTETIKDTVTWILKNNLL